MNAPHSRTTRILFVDHTAAMSGGEIALLHLAAHLNRSLYTPLVLLGSQGDLHDRMAEAGVETHLLELNPHVVNTRKDSLGTRSLFKLRAIGATATYAVRLAEFIRQHQIDIVHTNSLKSDIYGGLAARLAGRPVIWHVRDRIADDYLPAFVARLFRRLCRVIPTYVIANSEATLETLRLPRHKRAPVGYAGSDWYRVVHDGVVTGEITGANAADVERGATAARLRRIGLVGRISPWKGQNIFIQAAAALRDRFPDARFQIIGSAMFGEQAYETELHTFVAAHRLQEQVEFLGFRPDITKVVADLDILVHASTVPEPFGQVVIEGMAASKPVVATRGGGVTEILTDGVSGLLVTMGSVEELTQALHNLLTDPNRAEQLGKAARAVVQERFTIEQTVLAVQGVYETIAHGNAQKKGGKPTRPT